MLLFFFSLLLAISLVDMVAAAECDSAANDHGGRKSDEPMSLIDARVGNPVMLAQVVSHAVPGLDLRPRSSYGTVAANQPASELRTALVLLHNEVGNIDSAGWHLVVGHGATQLIDALFAVAANFLRVPNVTIFSQTPYYSAYRTLAGAAFSDSATSPCESTLEIVASPNNPTGLINSPQHHCANLRVLDAAYAWPTSGATIAAATKRARDTYDAVLFSASKLAGVAASRLGWAWIRDAELARLVAAWINVHTIGVSIDSQLAVARVAHALARHTQALALAHSEQQRTWDVVSAASARAALFDVLSTRGSFYLWVRCRRGLAHARVDVDCAHELRRRLGVDAASGVAFGASSAFARINLSLARADIDEFVWRLEHYPAKYSVCD